MCNIAEFTNSKKDKLYAEISCEGCEPLGRKQEQTIQSLKKNTALGWPKYYDVTLNYTGTPWFDIDRCQTIRVIFSLTTLLHGAHTYYQTFIVIV